MACISAGENGDSIVTGGIFDFMVKERKIAMRAEDRQKQYVKQKESILKEYPELRKLDQAKSKWMRILAYFMLLSRIVYVLAIVQMGNADPVMVLSASFVGYSIYALFLFFCLRGNSARNVYGLYVPIFEAAYKMVKQFQVITSWDMMKQTGALLFQNYPVAGVSYILFYAGFALHLGVTIWLTLVPKNWRLANQYDALMKKGGVEKNISSISSMARWTSGDSGDREEK